MAVLHSLQHTEVETALAPFRHPGMTDGTAELSAAGSIHPTGASGWMRQSGSAEILLAVLLALEASGCGPDPIIRRLWSLSLSAVAPAGGQDVRRSPLAVSLEEPCIPAPLATPASAAEWTAVRVGIALLPQPGAVASPVAREVPGASPGLDVREEAVAVSLMREHAAEDPTGPDTDLAELRAHLERGDVTRARELVATLRERWPDSPAVAAAARILAPPKVRVVPQAQPESFEREYAWLDAHAREYSGCWLAILGDQLLAAGDLAEVLEKLRGIPGGDRALLHRRPGPRS